MNVSNYHADFSIKNDQGEVVFKKSFNSKKEYLNFLGKYGITREKFSTSNTVNKLSSSIWGSKTSQALKEGENIDNDLKGRITVTYAEEISEGDSGTIDIIEVTYSINNGLPEPVSDILRLPKANINQKKIRRQARGIGADE